MVCVKIWYGIGYYHLVLDCTKGLEEDGPMCLAFLERYYWNNDLQKCELGIYGGCRPTANNFPSKKACEKAGKRYCLRHK